MRFNFLKFLFFRFKDWLCHMLWKTGEIYYIGGSDTFPSPLNAEEEALMVGELGGENDLHAKSVLIERNLRLVVYIARKFENTGINIEDLISIGTIGLIADPKRENPRARMLGYALSKDYWGLGIMTEAAKSVISYGFKSPCTDIITCCCYSYNKRSRRVIEKCGFIHEGTLHDGEMRYDGEIFDLECFVLSK
mgnify:CR=1 FL=1